MRAVMCDCLTPDARPPYVFGMEGVGIVDEFGPGAEVPTVNAEECG